jgi:tumor protein p53-inducible protein 3
MASSPSSAAPAAPLPSRMLAVLLKQPGGPDQMFVGEADVPTPKPQDLLIKVFCTAINRADILQREGHYPPPAGESPIIGLEAAGEVVACGADCQRGFRLGDRVMALLPGGGYAQFARVHDGSVMRIPPALSFEQAAAIPETWLTAFQLLHRVAHLRKGDYVLVHAGASGVGTAAIQLAVLAGAKPIAVVGSAPKVEYCLSLGAIAGLLHSAPQTPWADEVLRITGGAGVDVILDCIGASHFRSNLKCAATDSRWVLYGLMGGGELEEKTSLAPLLRKRIQLLSSTLRTRSLDYKADLCAGLSELLPRFASGELKVVVDAAFDLKDIGRAHERMHAAQNMGKVVVRVPH